MRLWWLLASMFWLATVPAPALAQGFNLVRVPEPSASIPQEPLALLKQEKHRLDGRHEGVKGMFDRYQAECGTVAKAREVPCQASRREVLEFARAYIGVSCAYKKANADELDKLMVPERAEIARYQQQIKLVGIEATAHAYEQWTEVSAEQRDILEKERLSYVIEGVVHSVAIVAEVGASSVAVRVVTPEQVTKIVDALKRRGVTDERLLNPIRELPTMLNEHARVEMAHKYVEAVKANVQLQLKEYEIRKSRDSFERAWAAAQAAIVVVELVGKPLVRAASAPAQAATAAARVSAVATAAPGAIQIVGNSAIGYFWTYRNMTQLASLPDEQLVQIQMLAGLMEGPVIRLRTLKEKRAPFVGDKLCGT